MLNDVAVTCSWNGPRLYFCSTTFNVLHGSSQPAYNMVYTLFNKSFNICWSTNVEPCVTVWRFYCLWYTGDLISTLFSHILLTLVSKGQFFYWNVKWSLGFNSRWISCSNINRISGWKNVPTKPIPDQLGLLAYAGAQDWNAMKPFGLINQNKKKEISQEQIMLQFWNSV